MKEEGVKTRRLRNQTCSTGLPGGNQVDGLPLVRHTEAVVGPHGGSGSAPTGKIEVRKSKIEENCKFTLPERSDRVLDTIVKFHFN